ncbi:MAG: YbaB/EbfC family nucleoid-associated protein [Fluviicola sp.]
MFGPEFLQQLAQLKNATDSGMSKLPSIILEGTAGNGLVRIKMDGTYALKSLEIAADIKLMETEDLEDFLAIALRQAIDQVTTIREKELYNSLTDLVANGKG